MRIIKYILIVSVMIIAWPLFSHGQAGSSNGRSESCNVELTLALDSHAVKVGSPITVTITMINHGPSDFMWESERPNPAFRNFRYRLIAADGKEAPFTLLHRQLRDAMLPTDPEGAPAGSSTLAVLSPGKSISFVADIDKLYNIKEPGSYVLSVERSCGKHVNVRSLPMTIYVTGWRLVISMIGNGQGETQIPRDMLEVDLPTGRVLE